MSLIVTNLSNIHSSVVMPHVSALNITRYALREYTGVFFFASGFNKCFVPAIRDNVQGLFARLHVPKPLAVMIPIGEMFGGAALIVNFLTPLAVIGLWFIILGAIVLDCWQTDVIDKHPKNPLDFVAKILYMPELMILVNLTLIFILYITKE